MLRKSGYRKVIDFFIAGLRHWSSRMCEGCKVNYYVNSGENGCPIDFIGEVSDPDLWYRRRKIIYATTADRHDLMTEQV